MNHEINKIIKDPEMAQRFQSMGYELSGSTPQELGAHLKEETVKWGKVVKQAGAQLE
jgi:tripartite-type tricarboxylate transporter receptor subunit TctC